MAPVYHPLSERGFSYVAVSGSIIEVKVGESTVVFNIQTADELVDILTGYVQDYRHARTKARDPGFRPLVEIWKGV